MPLAVLGVSHHTAPIEVRERMAFGPVESADALLRLREEEGVREAVLLSTCNRTEVYLFPASDPRALRGVERLFGRRVGALDGRVRDFLFEQRGDGVVRHLYQVCSGLDSLVTGEAEIQGQVRDAYHRAAELDASPPLTGPVLNRLFQTALSVGGQVRSETGIGEGAASVASVSVELARKIFGSLRGKRVLILGAGQTGEMIVQALSREGVEGITVANRTYDRAVELAQSVRGSAVSFERLGEGLAAVDIVLASTSAPHAILTRERFGEAFPDGLRRKLLVIDIAVPRDVDPSIGDEGEVFLYNVDDLRKIVDERVRLREGAIPSADRIVRARSEEFRSWYASLEAVPVIRRLRDRAEEHRERELARLVRGLDDLSDEERERVEDFSRRLVNKLLHEPTVRLRKGLADRDGPDLVEAVRFLYGLEDSPATPGRRDAASSRERDESAGYDGGHDEGGE